MKAKQPLFTTYLSLILCCLMFFSCKTTKQSVSIPEPVIIYNTDSVKTEYIETLRIDTVTVEVFVPIETAMQIVRDSTSFLETNFAMSWAWINIDGTLGHKLNNKEQKISTEAYIPVTDTSSTSTKISIEEVPVPYPVKEYIERDFTSWENFRLKAFWYLLGISLALGIWSFRKPIINLISRFK